MKLETAYAKLFKHWHWWQILIQFDPDDMPRITATLRDSSDWPSSVDVPSQITIWRRGLANAMYAAAVEIEKRNRVVDLHKEIMAVEL